MALGHEDVLTDVVSSVVAAAGFDVEELTVRPDGGRRMVRVVIDRDDGVDLDVAAAVSRGISSALDAQGDAVFGDAPYTLEVTSRGISSPLTQPRHFRRAHGRLVSITRTDGSTLTARIAALRGNDLVVLSGVDGITTMTIALNDVTKAVVEVEFFTPSTAVTAALAEFAAPSGDRVGDTGDAGDAGDTPASSQMTASDATEGEGAR